MAVQHRRDSRFLAARPAVGLSVEPHFC